MPSYCVNRNPQPSGEHEVHNLDAGCADLPQWANRIDLGSHDACYGAVIEARKIYRHVDGCYYCARDCHSR